MSGRGRLGLLVLALALGLGVRELFRQPASGARPAGDAALATLPPATPGTTKPAATTPGKTTPGEATPPAAGPERILFPSAGFSVELGEGLAGKQVEAGVNRILRVERAGQLVLVLNSAPLYPWVDLETLRPVALGAEGPAWSRGPLSSDGLEIPLGAEAAWARLAGPTGKLVVVAEGRWVAISCPQPGLWADPQVRALLASFRAEPGADYGSVYRELYGLDAARAAGAPTKLLLASMKEGLEILGPEGTAAVAPILAKGIAAHRAGELDHSATMMLFDALKPSVRRAMKAAANSEGGDVAACSVGAGRFADGAQPPAMGRQPPAPFPPVEWEERPE